MKKQNEDENEMIENFQSEFIINTKIMVCMNVITHLLLK